MQSDTPKNSPFPVRNPVLRAVRNALVALRKLRLRLRAGGKISFGPNTHVAGNCEIRPPDYARIDRDVSIGRDFTCQVNMVVGPEVLISSEVAVIGNQHKFDDPNSSVYWQGRMDEDVVVIEGDNLIGFRSIIVGNVTIGKGCIVAAGSVVTRSLPPYTVCGGVPARVIRARFKQDGDAVSAPLPQEPSAARA